MEYLVKIYNLSLRGDVDNLSIMVVYHGDKARYKVVYDFQFPFDIDTRRWHRASADLISAFLCDSDFQPASDNVQLWDVSFLVANIMEFHIFEAYYTDDIIW